MLGEAEAERAAADLRDIRSRMRVKHGLLVTHALCLREAIAIVVWAWADRWRVRRDRARARRQESKSNRRRWTMRGVGMDARYAFRQLRRQPLIALAAVCTLALGIGANTSIFTVVNGVLLHPLPYEDADRLVLGLRGSREAGMLLTPDGELIDLWRTTGLHFPPICFYCSFRCISRRGAGLFGLFLEGG
jgi:hypothetical protein